MMKKVLLSTACILVLTGGASTETFAAEAERILTVGIVPQQSASRLAKIWVPALNAWSDRSGYKLIFETAKDIPTFEACLAKGAYDIAYMNPYHYTVFHKQSGYKAFARQADKMLKGIIVARQDADAKDLSSLDGGAVAFPSPAAFGASVIPRAELRQMGINFTPRYVRSHDSVYRAVSAGLIPAGGGVLRTFNTVDPEIRDQLKVIYQTDGYTPHAFAARDTLSSEAVEKVFEAMQYTNQEGSEVLTSLGMKGIIGAVDSDWDDVRALNLAASHTDIVDDESLQCHSD